MGKKVRTEVVKINLFVYPLAILMTPVVYLLSVAQHSVMMVTSGQVINASFDYSKKMSQRLIISYAFNTDMCKTINH